MSPKLLFVLLGILFILFFVGVGAGISQDDRRPPALTVQNGQAGGPGWLTRLGSLLPKDPLTVDAILRAEPLRCLQPNPDQVVVQGSQDCQLQIAPARGNRTLTWQLTSGNEASLTLKQPVNADGGSVTAKYTVKQGEQARLDVYRQQQANDQIVLTIVCTDGGTEGCGLTWPTQSP